MVLGEGNRYAIENYLLDPLLLTALILRKKAWKFARESLGIDEALTYVSLAEISATAAQAIVDSVINRLDLSTSNPTPTKYASGLVVELPAAFRVMRGHDLAARIVDRMQPLSGYATHEAMIDEVVDTILRELPGLMPAEILATFQRLQESTI
jgi:regulator of protease activity HflC (stomatin/prohibitin superfamily)